MLSTAGDILGLFVMGGEETLPSLASCFDLCIEFTYIPVASDTITLVSRSRTQHHNNHKHCLGDTNTGFSFTDIPTTTTTNTHLEAALGYFIDNAVHF
ncbi:hypothetical protein Pmani_000222 [Petrolisthes manimaculis]|uniref:Uncharacterized protein n=1 Tax=Petrolisthes manimaculis TaxID=1843537 RepID=A0AAE1USZ8_9EUCA|nr:hypothetical protein Pmani_000222 [Petrolisthes manimaculis]